MTVVPKLLWGSWESPNCLQGRGMAVTPQDPATDRDKVLTSTKYFFSTYLYQDDTEGFPSFQV